MLCNVFKFLPLILLICFCDSALFAFEFAVPHIPSASCSFDGGKLCPGIPGNVVQANLQKGECGASLNRLCGNVAPGEGRLANCLRENGHLIDEQCAAWGRRVGLDFAAGKARKLKDPKSVTPQEEDYLGAYGQQIQDPCFGSGWFNNPTCQKVETKVDSPDILGAPLEEKPRLPQVQDLYPMPGSVATPPGIFGDTEASSILNSLTTY